MTRIALPWPESSREVPIDEWLYLDLEVLLPSSHRKFCLSCHWFCHQAEPDGIPLLTCQLHRGLLAHGEHLTHRCSAWTKHDHLDDRCSEMR